MRKNDSNQEILERIFWPNGQLYAYSAKNTDKPEKVLLMSLIASFICFVKDLEKEGKLTVDDMEKGLAEVLTHFEAEFSVIKNIKI